MRTERQNRWGNRITRQTIFHFMKIRPELFRKIWMFTLLRTQARAHFMKAAHRTVLAAFTIMVALLWITGCATKPQAPKVYTFFPPPPDEPRIQYLTSFGSEDDLSKRSHFQEFVVGEQRVHRPIWKPYGITASRGKIYICDTEAFNLCVVDVAKGQIRAMKPSGEAALVLPMNVAVDKDGTRYITDINRRQVLIYDKEGNYLIAIGKQGEMRPCGIALSGDRFYVTDLLNRCVRVYDKTSHEMLFTIPRKPPGEGKSLIYGPTNVAIDREGHVYITDTGGYNVQVFDSEGNHMRTIGDQGPEPGHFLRPKGIAVDHEKRIYVVDSDTQVVQVLDSEGKPLMYFGYPKASGAGALYLPAGVAVDYENVDLFKQYAAPGRKIEFLIFVTNQAGKNKVSVYGFLHKDGVK